MMSASAMQRSAWEAELNASLSSLEQVPCFISQQLHQTVCVAFPRSVACQWLLRLTANCMF